MKSFRFFLFTILFFSLFATTFLSAQDIIHITDDEQLFLEKESIIEKSENLIFKVHQAEKFGPPVLRPDKPWENGMAILHGSAMFDEEEGLFKMWYYTGSADVAYATSPDGIHWDKPELDIYLHEGQKTNLILKRSDWEPFRAIFGVYKDPHETDPNRRYKMGYLSKDYDYQGPYQNKYKPGRRLGFGTAYSPDGIHFTLGNLFATDEICDISNFFYDKKSQEFVMFGRCLISKVPREDLGVRFQHNTAGRGVVQLTSKDFEHWTEGKFVYAAERTDPEGTEIYCITNFRYSNLIIHMIRMLHALPGQGLLDYQIGYSHDGTDIVRLEPRTTFLPEGDVGSWDRFNISIGNNIPVKVGDEWWFYYGGRTYRHSPYKGPDTFNGKVANETRVYRCQVGLAKVKRGRLYSAEASFDGGTLRTRPFYFGGDKLFVNANAEYGKLTIKLLDKENQPIEGCTLELTGVDSVDIPVELKNFDMGTLKGKAVKIEFTLENVQLFGFRID